MRLRVCLLCSLLVAVASHAQDDDWGGDEWSDDLTEARLQWSGFLEAAAGSRWDEDPQTGRRQTLGDFRLRAETQWSGGRVDVSLKGEAWYDSYLQEVDAELRDLTLAFSPGANWDIKVGRQVLTWGTGDLLFLNDLFPKDWVSFFAGREDEYLKAPSNTVRSTWYSDAVNIDFAWTPLFTADEYLNGERFSFFSPLAGERVAPNPPLAGIEPKDDFSNGEFSLRLFRTLKGTEWALYAYNGFFHQPSAVTESFEPTFAPLTSLGASMRGTLGKGLFNAETTYYASRDDRDGNDPRIPNDQVRILLGYEQEAVTNFTVAFQYYLEWLQDYGDLVDNSLTPTLEPDEFRHVFTNRLTYRLQQDKLTLSLFTFYSPSDSDYYIRPAVAYRYSDDWSFSGGANIFGGSDTGTFFNQFADNSNVYFRIRYNY